MGVAGDITAPATRFGIPHLNRVLAMAACTCDCNRREAWGWDAELVVYACSNCGGRVDNPPNWLIEKVSQQLKDASNENHKTPGTKTGL